ncbi:MAG: hypothetical protein JWM11_5035, partial [Planctomycetaceae bacterium]|nr:hypothetical protein [Planctomycetaceae bacterium]
RLFPEVDSTRHNCHCLIIALQRTEFHDSPWQLYCAELQRHPQLVHADEHQSLLDSTIPSWRLFDLLEHRWRAALQDNSWERVGSDLDRLRDKLKFDSTTTWIRVLFQAVDLAAWSGHPVARQIFQQSKDEIQELSNVQEQLIADFFRYDLLLEAMTTTPLEQLKIVDDDFPEFSRDDWQQSLDHPDPRFRSALETWVSNPRRVLKLLTGFWKHARHAFGHICRIIESLDCDQSRANAFRKRETILDTVQEFLLARKTMKYGRLRVELLEFCITNQIALDQVLSCFEDWMVFSMEKGTLAFLRKDRPLEIVLRGIFAFWK